jgi:hypothetical protein
VKQLLKSLNQRPIALYPAYIKVAGSLAAGALLSQCMYWFGKKDKFHKTDADFIAELGLTANEMRGAKTKLKKLKFIKITRKGVPAKTWYSIDWDAYQEAMTVQFSEIHQTDEFKGFLGNPSLVKFTKLDSLNSPNKISGFHSSFYSNTKITTKTTTESKKKTTKKPPAPPKQVFKNIDLSNLDPLVDIEVAKEWITHRIGKKCPLKEQSTFDRHIDKAIKISNQTFTELGLTPSEVITEAIDAGWQGIGAASWYRNRLGAKNANNTKESTFEREERHHQEYLRQRERLMGCDAQQVPQLVGGTQRGKLL